ncbi:MAG: hypothetical protein IPH46_17080 [Bacteroidetes bacterium]|nr:hypothetical protein [Bacteroidota bacterium]
MHLKSKQFVTLGKNEISYIQGPPGTGKSHTISAIILSALALNKKSWLFLRNNQHWK